MQTTTGTGPAPSAARLAELERMETTASVLAELTAGAEGGRATIAWMPRSLRELPPGEVRITVKCGELEVEDAMPCAPSTPEERAPKAAQDHQLTVRGHLLKRVIGLLAGRTPGSSAKKPMNEPASEREAEGSVVSDAVKRCLRVARTPIAIGEIAKRTGYEVARIRKVLPGLRARGIIAPKGTQKSGSGHQENLWIITAKGME